jgi:hypothetical protein
MAYKCYTLAIQKMKYRGGGVEMFKSQVGDFLNTELFQCIKQQVNENPEIKN